jgi:FKBP-type peptidyl-prolyl cis-trans isomerase FkpA
MKKFLFVFSILTLITLSACKKDENTLITDYAAKQGWNLKSTSQGVYYVVDTLGTGGRYPNLSSTVNVQYKGYLLDGTVFDSNSSATGLGISLQSVIQGWQYGIPNFQKGGVGKLLIPSSLGYGSTADQKDAAGNVTIPCGSVLVFEIKLVDFR